MNNSSISCPLSPIRAAFRRFHLACLLSCVALLSWPAHASIVAWGNNNNLQAQPPGNLTNVVMLAGGTLHSLALRSNGTVVAWGDNLFGQTNVPPGLSAVAAIAAGGYHSLALKSNGTVVVWGDQPAAPGGLTNVTAIAAGWEHDLALTRDGSVVAWGAVSNVPPGLGTIVAIAAGHGHCLALRADGRVIGWGDNAFGKTNVPPNATNIIAIAAGKDHSVALRRDGQVIAWGGNYDGQASVPAGLTNIAAISAGAFHTLALRANGTLAAWGSDVFNQTTVPDWSGFSSIASGAYHNLTQLGIGAPTILVQPVSQTVKTTGTATFHITAAGQQPLQFQWRRQGTNLVGRTNASLTFPNLQLSDAGVYSVVVANSLGSATSLDAILTPFTMPPLVMVPPQDRTAFCGDGAMFQITADGSAPLRYQWLFEGAEIVDATNRTFALATTTTNHAGGYSVIVTNEFGALTSVVATLTVDVQSPVIIGPLPGFGTQGQPFTYTIAADHAAGFSAGGLPPGLAVDPLTGVISGTPLEPGTFQAQITVANACGQDAQTLVLSIDSGVPGITSAPTATGTEGMAITPYRITATSSPSSFDAVNLPTGLSVDRDTGLISGTPVQAGTYSATILASNVWGTGSATLQFTIANAIISGLQLSDVTFNYHSPYLLDFEFTLQDSNGNGIITHPSLFSVVCMENTHPGTTNVTWPDDEPDLPTATTLITNVVGETGVFVARSTGSGGKVIKTYLVLDYTESLSDPVLNGDINGDGISDAVDYMVSGAQYFVNQQPIGSQVGVYEFHRDDEDPNQVIALTDDKSLLNQAIAGIWTNHVNWFYAGSRCWDAVDAAILDLGSPNPDEQRSVIFISDGLDSSSIATPQQVIADARIGGVRVYCIAFGNNPDLVTLGQITAATGGRLFVAQSQEELFEEFAQVAKDVQARYTLRWASLRRDGTEIAPFFLLSYQGHTATPPEWTWSYQTNMAEVYLTNIIIDTTVDPPVTNLDITTNDVTNISVLWENPALGPYIATNYAGTVTVGTVRLVLNEEVEPTGVTLRASYIPRFIRQLRLRYRANWPCTTSLNATNVGEMLYGWSLSESNAVDGSTWLLLSNPYPQSTTNSLPFPGFGPLVTFNFKDVLSSPGAAFALIEIDNSIYTNIPAGGQQFVFEPGNTTNFVTSYPALPFGTPVPWLIGNGFTNNFEAAETNDFDGDGVITWQEYRANTDPLDPDSRFVVRSLATDTYGRYQITFSTAVNRRYRVETSFDLINWEIVQDDIPGTGGDLTVPDNRFHPWITQVFYRATVY